MKTVTLYVTYQGTPQSRFDREYYNSQHLPLVMASFARYGLLSVAAFYPALQQPGTLAICECIFRDETAIEASFSSPEATAVMADVGLFTDITPVRLRAGLI
jgi:uncharacterized protein (TIGR02118 family)